jgi:hypothetical protein
LVFEAWYKDFMIRHERGCSKERLRRLREGHGHAERLFLEQVWWPAVGHLDDLHPEYEVWDFKDGVRFLDFAYLRGTHRVCIEIDGFGPHGRDLKRWQFSDRLTPQNHLVLDQWKVLRFSYDDINEKPRRCQQMIQQMLGRWFGVDVEPQQLTLKEREIMRLVIHSRGPVTPAAVCERLGIGNRHARDLLRRLVQAGLLSPVCGQLRVRSYGLKPEAKPSIVVDVNGKRDARRG